MRSHSRFACDIRVLLFGSFRPDAEHWALLSIVYSHFLQTRDLAEVAAVVDFLGSVHLLEGLRQTQ